MSEATEKRTAIFLLVREGRVLMEWRTYGDRQGWVYPGGKIRPSETPLVAVCREFEEEMGQSLGSTRDGGAIVTPLDPIDGFEGYRVWPFIIQGYRGLAPQTTDRGDALEWIPFGQALKQSFWSTSNPVIARALRALMATGPNADVSILRGRVEHLERRLSMLLCVAHHGLALPRCAVCWYESTQGAHQRTRVRAAALSMALERARASMATQADLIRRQDALAMVGG